jgi:hypothetical protein
MREKLIGNKKLPVVMSLALGCFSWLARLTLLGEYATYKE